MLALLVAACFALAWVLRLGWLADYFSRPVLVGYIHGVAVVLIIGQLGKLLGLSIEARDPLAQLWEVLRELGSVSGPTFALSVRARSQRCSGSASLHAQAAGGAACRHRRDRALVGARPAGARRRGGRRDSRGLPSFDVPTPPGTTCSSWCRRPSASSSSRSRTRS